MKKTMTGPAVVLAGVLGVWGLTTRSHAAPGERSRLPVSNANNMGMVNLDNAHNKFTGPDGRTYWRWIGQLTPVGTGPTGEKTVHFPVQGAGGTLEAFGEVAGVSVHCSGNIPATATKVVVLYSRVSVSPQPAPVPVCDISTQ